MDEPASRSALVWLHERFYHDAPSSLVRLARADRTITMRPGVFRFEASDDVAVGRHIPPSSDRVEAFVNHFAFRYRFSDLGKSARITAMAAAHHRLNYIHPFPDGNGRVSRLMSHAMAARAGIGAHGLWSISRGLARGLESRTEYKAMMDRADTPRRSSTDGRGNLSQQALEEFVDWFLRVCLDQIRFMAGLFAFEKLQRRIHTYVERADGLRPETARLLDEAYLRGEFDRGEAARITGLPERSARRILGDAIEAGLLASDTPKGAVSLRFATNMLETLFPALFPET
ncbi:MAG: hypothetical protein NVSMB64_30760 [Candidatus Velthaea sp.]